MLRSVFTKPEQFRIFWRQIFREIDGIGINSLPIIALLSVFMGAVITLQTASNMDSPLLPAYTIGYITRQSTILEFSPTILSLILAGKVGSNIASEIGTMRVTEQIDALEIMGINSIGFLMLPKVVAAVFIFPFLVIISMGLSIFGGWVAGVQSGLTTTNEYVFGIQAFFQEGDIVYALIKTVTFAFLITSISSFYGYFTKGGALEVGRSSTKAVVYSSIAILLMNFILTKLLLFD